LWRRISHVLGYRTTGGGGEEEQQQEEEQEQEQEEIFSFHKFTELVLICILVYIFKTPRQTSSHIFLKRHLQSFADLWPTLMGFSIYI
jgi:hypothetical protein